MRSLSLLLQLGLAAGCSSGSIEWLPFPGNAGAASMILAVERESELQLYAFDLQPKPTSIRPAIAFGEEPATLTALLLRTPLDELGMREGKLMPAPAPNRPVADLDIAASYLAALHGGHAFEWAEIPAASPAILGFLVPDPNDPCPAFEQILVLDHRGTNRSFLVPLPDGGALAGYANTVSRITAEGEVAESAPLPDLIAAASTSTTIFVVADALYRASVDPLRFARIADAPEFLVPAWMSAGSGDQIFSFSNDGSFGFFDGRSWRLIERLPIDGQGVSKGGAIWVAPNVGVAINGALATLARWEGGALHYDLPPLNVLGFSAGLRSVRYGAVAIDDRFGQLFRYDGAGLWSVLPIAGAPPQVQALTDFRGGIAWGTSTGFVGHASEEVSCGSEPALEASEIYEVAPLGDGLLVGYEDRNTNFVLVYFRPVEK